METTMSAIVAANKAVHGQQIVADFFAEYLMKVFTLCAYYDKHMDCIRVQSRDCSITEERRDALFTVLKDNYPKKDSPSTWVLRSKAYITCSLGWIFHLRAF